MKRKPGRDSVDGQASAETKISAASNVPEHEPETTGTEDQKAVPAEQAQDPKRVADRAGVSGQLTKGSAARLEIATSRKWVSQIGAHTVGRNGVPAKELKVLPVEQIAYVFRGSLAIGPASGNRLVDELGIRWIGLDPEGVYVRTIKNELLLTELRSVAEMQEWLHPDLFLTVNRGLLINIRRMNLFDLKANRVGFEIAGAAEWVNVSKRAARVLRGSLLLPARSSVSLPPRNP